MSLLLLLLSCTDNPPVRQSTPVQQDGPVTVELGPGNPVNNPVDLATLGAVYPDLLLLPKYPGLAAVGAMNLVPAPCGPCEDSLARCALAPPVGCENLPVLVSRAVRLAGEDNDPDQIRAALAYPDVWVADSTAAQTESVDVEVWVEPGGPAVQQTLARIAEVEAAAGDVPVRVHLRVLWTDEEREAAALRVLAAESPDAARSALGREGGPPPDPALRQRLQAEQDVARTKGVRSAPTWFVEGYRLRGLQSARVITHLITLSWDDLRMASSPQPDTTP